MGLFRGRDSRQLITGLFLLVLLAAFSGSNALPNFLSELIPWFDESLPCGWLKTAENRAQHQSLIGRSAINPLALEVRASPLPTTPEGSLVITITVINRSIGTVPFVYHPQQVIVGDNNTNGVGLTFNPQVGLSTGGSRPANTGAVPENNIRLLGPRQRCVHRVEFPASQLGSSLATGTATVSAYYRNNTSGQIVTAQQPGQVIFPDQGLWTGIITTDPVVIPLSSG